MSQVPWAVLHIGAALLLTIDIIFLATWQGVFPPRVLVFVREVRKKNQNFDNHQNNVLSRNLCIFFSQTTRGSPF